MVVVVVVMMMVVVVVASLYVHQLDDTIQMACLMDMGFFGRQKIKLLVMLLLLLLLLLVMMITSSLIITKPVPFTLLTLRRAGQWVNGQFSGAGVVQTPGCCRASAADDYMMTLIFAMINGAEAAALFRRSALTRVQATSPQEASQRAGPTGGAFNCMMMEGDSSSVITLNPQFCMGPCVMMPAGFTGAASAPAFSPGAASCSTRRGGEGGCPMMALSGMDCRMERGA